MKRFLVQSFAFVIPALVALVVVNFMGLADRAGSGVEIDIATALAEGLTVGVESNLNERALKRALVAAQGSNRATVVLGSSRVMEIGERLVGPDVVNLGVSGASIEDFVALIQLYRTRGITVPRYLIGLDPWILNENSEQDRWIEFSEEFETFEGSRPRSRWHEIGRLLSPNYFRFSVDALWGRLFQGEVEFKTFSDGHAAPGTFIFLPDGSIRYGAAYREVSAAEVMEKARAYTLGTVYSLDGFTALSSRLQDLLTELVAAVRADGSEIELLLVPYHPLVYDVLGADPKYEQVAAFEAWVQDQARSLDIPLRGALDPSRLGLGNRDFYDGMHVRDEALASVLNFTGSNRD
jgi:hypothetical protein